ncbi:ROK family protein [Benzoatithermus flavus]|uniref:ROK family protein n=1 Tax=Benzoatithermus flavus TaxID=3108223 RepID=UPI003AAE5D48
MAIGVDLGGTKIEAVALDEDGRELLRRRRPTPPPRRDAVPDAIAGLVREVEVELGQRCTVGVAHPGAISPVTGLLKNCNITALNGRPFDRELAETLGRPVALANDANCLALSEARDGAGAGAAVVFAAILGTGVGGGIVVHGRVLGGANGIAGEWGHNPLPQPLADERPGPACYCGRHGCLENWLSGYGLAMDHRRRFGENLTAPELIDRAKAGDHAALTTLRHYEDRLARALAGVINILDPDVIVLGGGLSNVRRLYANVAVRWQRYVFSDQVRTKLLPPLHGDSSGARGAAWLGRELAGAS